MELPNTGADYVDLKNIDLYVRGQLKKADGTSLEKAESVVLTNNALHSLFETVTVLVGHNQQEIQMNNYLYKAYIRQLMHTKTTSPACQEHGFTDDSKVAKAEEVTMGLTRYPWTSESKVAEFLGPTYIDVFQTDGYLMPATPLRITFKRSREAFYLTTAVANKDTAYKFFIDKIGLYVPTVKVAPFMTPLLEMQTDESPARYRFDSIDARQFPLPANTTTRTFARLYQGTLPTRIAIAFYRQDSFLGTRDRASLLTADLDLKQMQLAINGLVVQQYDVDISKNIYMEPFRRLTDWLGVTDGNFPFDLKQFRQGVSFFTFDLMENCSSNTECDKDSLLTGFAELSLQFGFDVPTDCVMMVFAIFPDTLDITKQKALRYNRVIVLSLLVIHFDKE